MAGCVCGMLGHLEQLKHKRVASTVPRLSTFSQRVCLLRHNLAIYLFKFTSWSHPGAALGLGSLSFGTGTHMVLKWVCRDGLIRSAGSRKLRWSVYFAGITKSLRLMWKQGNPTSPKSIWRWVFLFIGLINVYLCGSVLLMWIDVPDVVFWSYLSPGRLGLYLSASHGPAALLSLLAPDATHAPVYASERFLGKSQRGRYVNIAKCLIHCNSSSMFVLTIWMKQPPRKLQQTYWYTVCHLPELVNIHF